MKKVWIEINEKAAKANVRTMRGLLKPSTKLFAVVKSNAYGHGLTLFSDLVQNDVDGFCVDSVIEGMKLREAGIKKPILVLGPTLPNGALADAATNDIAITVSTKESLDQIVKSKFKPAFHLKVDTGMHRQGFYPDDLKAIAKTIKARKLPLVGVYTHFAAAKDLNYPTFTNMQFKEFGRAEKILKTAGFKKLIRHASATGGTMVDQKYHLDMVRVGIGLYGLWPSRELELQVKRVKLLPALSWHALVSEVKKIPHGSYIGYDLAEGVSRETTVAIIPIGYWHGFDRGLSHVGEVLIQGKKAKVLGRVSMDLIAVDATGISVKPGTVATIIGKQGKAEIRGRDMADKIDTTHYEIVTRINPLIERVAS